MTSTIKVNNIQNQCGANIINESSNTITIGASGDTVSLASGASQTGFGRTGTVDWDTTAKTASFTAVSGNGYFVNTTSSAITVTLPASPSAGDIVSVKDYAYTFSTNNLTVNRNGSPIGGGTDIDTIVYSTDGDFLTFIYVDGTQGWVLTNDSTNTDTTGAAFITATGGTVLTCGNFKTHVFTGPGTFTVTCVGNPGGSDSVEYLVVAAGGGGGRGCAAGSAGAGGMRFRTDCGSASPFNAPAKLPVCAQAYPITVGAAGAGAPPSPTSSAAAGTNGSNSTFSTITSTGGGAGGAGNPTCQPSPSPSTNNSGKPGGSGGGGGHNSGVAGTGNTPPVSPSQGNPGQASVPVNDDAAGGGGGAGAAATLGSPTTVANGGAGTYIPTTFIGPTAPSYGETGPQGRFFAGGGGASVRSSPANPVKGSGGLGGGADGITGNNPGNNGSTNMGGGASGGASNGPAISGGNGGSGIVMIRYKFQ